MCTSFFSAFVWCLTLKSNAVSKVIIGFSESLREYFGRCVGLVKTKFKKTDKKQKNIPQSNSTPPSRYLQGATVSLLQNHLHVVEDKVKSHAPNRLCRLLHESVEKRPMTVMHHRNTRKTREKTVQCLPFHIFYY